MAERRLLEAHEVAELLAIPEACAERERRKVERWRERRREQANYAESLSI